MSVVWGASIVEGVAVVAAQVDKANQYEWC